MQAKSSAVHGRRSSASRSFSKLSWKNAAAAPCAARARVSGSRPDCVRNSPLQGINAEKRDFVRFSETLYQAEPEPLVRGVHRVRCAQARDAPRRRAGWARPSSASRLSASRNGGGERLIELRQKQVREIPLLQFPKFVSLRRPRQSRRHPRIAPQTVRIRAWRASRWPAPRNAVCRPACDGTVVSSVPWQLAAFDAVGSPCRAAADI